MDGLAGLGLLSAGISAWGDIISGQAQQSAYNINASIVEIQGEQTQEEIEAQEKEMTSTQRAMYAKAGVTSSGSPLEVMLNTATTFETDKAIAKYNTVSKASMLRYEGQQAKNAQMFKAGLALLSGGVKAFEGMFSPTASDPRGTAGGYAAYKASQ